MSHYIPIEQTSKSRVRTGYERIIAQRSRLPFAYPALEDGKVLDINEKIKTITIEYKTKGIYVLSYGSDYTKNGGGGFYITQNVGLNNLKVGKSFKKDDILLYNTDYFYNDPYSSQVDLSIGLMENVALVEGAKTLSDGSYITKKVSEKLKAYPVRQRTIKISKSTTIHKVAAIGTKVKSIDPIIIFDESNLGQLDIKDIDVMNAISSLNKSIPKAKYTGTIVKIEAFYKCDISTMSDSVSKFIRYVNKPDLDKHNYAKNANNGYLYEKPESILSDKVDSELIDDDTIVIKFYIQQALTIIPGDKLVYDGALKSVISSVIDADITTEDGTLEIGGVTSASGVQNRMILSALFGGALESVLEKVEQKALDMYFK